MRLVHPGSGEADLDALYVTVGRPPPGRPWVLVNMITSVDGATAVDGTSGGLGGDADRAVFGRLRSVPDAIVAGAGTVRAEGYGPPKLDESARTARRERGQTALPRIVVVTRSLDLDPSSSLFTGDPAPLVATVAGAPTDARRRLEEAGVEVFDAGDDDVEVDALVAGLGDRGLTTLLVEGGPSLNGAFVAADLVDEVAWTISPHLVGGRSDRLAVADDSLRSRLEPAHVLVADDGTLLCRYVRRR